MTAFNQGWPIDDLDADYTPRYIWLARLLRAWIEDGTYETGTCLPSAKKLATAHRVSPATALHALQVLAREGYVKYVVGHPFYVLTRSPARS
jgi:GntR family transcriptional regulator